MGGKTARAKGGGKEGAYGTVGMRKKETTNLDPRSPWAMKGK